MYLNFNLQVRPDRKVLTTDEKTFLLNVERGDVAAVKRMVKGLFSRKINFYNSKILLYCSFAK